MRAGQLLLFSDQQHSRNKYIYSYTPNREEQRNLTGNSFKLIPFIALSFPPLSLQTKQPLCTPETQESATCLTKRPVQSWNFFSLAFCSAVNVVSSSCPQRSASSQRPPAPPISKSLPLVRRVVRRLGGREGREGESEREREREGRVWRMEGGRAA